MYGKDAFRFLSVLIDLLVGTMLNDELEKLKVEMKDKEKEKPSPSFVSPSPPGIPYKEFPVAANTSIQALASAIVQELRKGTNLVLSSLSSVPTHTAMKAVIRVNQMLAREDMYVTCKPLFRTRLDKEKRSNDVMLIRLFLQSRVNPYVEP